MSGLAQPVGRGSPPAPGRPGLWRAGRWLWWYLRELTGEADYDKYVAHVQSAHPDAPVPTRRQFERDKTDRAQRNPTVRCC